MESIDLAFPGPTDLAELKACSETSADLPSDPAAFAAPPPTAADPDLGDDSFDAAWGEFELAPFDEDVAEVLVLLFQGGPEEPEDATPVVTPESEPLAAEVSVLGALSLELTPPPANLELGSVDPLPAAPVEDVPLPDESGFVLGVEPDAPGADAAVEAPRAPVVPAAEDAHRAFVKALVGVALGAGATRAAAILPALLDGASAVQGLSAELTETLFAARVLERVEDSIRPREAFAAIADAWRRVLREETNDLSGCGASTLDEWGADLLTALGVGGEKKVDVKRELRKRGVLAFGMRAAA
jgi:hypothetical protein